MQSKAKELIVSIVLLRLFLSKLVIGSSTTTILSFMFLSAFNLAKKKAKAKVFLSHSLKQYLNFVHIRFQSIIKLKFKTGSLELQLYFILHLIEILEFNNFK